MNQGQGDFSRKALEQSVGLEHLAEDIDCQRFILSRGIELAQAARSAIQTTHLLVDETQLMHERCAGVLALLAIDLRSQRSQLF